MSDPVLSDGVGVLLARETGGIGVQPTTGWAQVQVNPGGITGFSKELVTVGRNPLSPNLTPEAGEVVGYNVSLKLMADLTRDLLETLREPLFRSNTKHGGNKGQSLYRPTGITSTGYTVAALGDLSNSLLIYARGFSNAANNGLKLLAGTSTSTEIKTTGLVVEASPPAYAIVEVAGVQGAAGDIQLDSSGNLTSTVLDFTTLGLTPGQQVHIGDPTSGALFAFTNAVYTGRAYVQSVAAHKITLCFRSWVIGAATSDASQTVRILFTRAIRNVPLTDTDYLKAPTLAAELSEPGAGIAFATDYTYGGGLGVDQFDIDIPVENKMTVTTSLIGMTMSDPGASRATGAASALAPLRAGLFSTSSKLKARVLKKSDESALSVDINGIKLSFKNNVKPMDELGVDGAANLIFGGYLPTLSIDAYVIDNQLTVAANNNTDAVVELQAKNGDGGIGLLLPRVKLTKPAKTYAEHTSVMIANDVSAVRDPATGLLQVLSEFAYLP